MGVLHDVVDLWKYLKDNPQEEARFNQCFNCRKLDTCDLGYEAEDAEGMCKECDPL